MIPCLFWIFRNSEQEAEDIIEKHSRQLECEICDIIENENMFEHIDTIQHI